MFPDRIEALTQREPLSEERKLALVNEVRRRRDAPVTLRHILATPDQAGQQEVYALYESPLYEGCTGAAPPASCPTPEEVALNPACRAHGIVHARFPGAAQPGGQGPSVQLMPLAEAGCDLRLRHWFVAKLDVDDQLDAYLEVVSSRVASKKPGPKRPQVTTEHRQLLYLWSGGSPDDGDGDDDGDDDANVDVEPSFFLDLATWSVERWREREPPVRESIVLFRDLARPAGVRALDFIQLLPCLDPWSDEACDPDLRQREVKPWGEGSATRP
ncbi:MAG: hypothetical protein IPI49_22035 [Myxococcales bacterium]|nr:hypothetical protein [Myxococcales bacterium]